MASRKRRQPLSDEERAEKRAAERKLMEQAIEQLCSSEGWQRWLRVRRHFHLRHRLFQPQDGTGVVMPTSA